MVHIGGYTLNVVNSDIFKLNTQKYDQQVNNHKIFLIKDFRTLKHLETTRCLTLRFFV